MDKMAKLLKDGSVLKNLVCNGKYFHIRCCAHILNLIVRNGLKVIDKSVVKLREGIKYIDGSESRFEKFYALAKRSADVSFSGGLWLDVVTRWNSTFVMLDRALKYRTALNLYFEELGVESVTKYQLRDDEWEKVESICNLLKPFDEITTLFSGSDYPTSNLYLEKVISIRSRLKNPIDDGDCPDDLKLAIVEMVEKFNKYWSDYAMVLSIAAVFDPRWKLKYVEFCFTRSYGMLEGLMKADELKHNLEVLFKEYQKMARVTNSIYTQDESLLIETESDDIEDILAIPITSVASESTFNMGGRIICKSRNALADSNIEALVTCKNWLTGYDDFTLDGASVGIVPVPSSQESSNA